MIEFDATHHIFRDRGTIIPSVTFILRCVGVVDEIPGYMMKYVQRGKAVHRAIELFDQGELDFSTLDDSIRGYMDAYWNWQKAHESLTRGKNEVILYNRDYQYAGIADKIMLDRFGGKLIPTIVEIKTGEEQDWHLLQSMAYSLAYLSMKKKANNRLLVYLRKDGSWLTQAVPGHTDIAQRWISIMQSFNAAREKHLAKLEKVALEERPW